MNKEMFLGVLRHCLTFVGGIIVMKGVADDAAVSEAIGSVISAVGLVFSVVSKFKK